MLFIYISTPLFCECISFSFRIATVEYPLFSSLLPAFFLNRIESTTLKLVFSGVVFVCSINLPTIGSHYLLLRNYLQRPISAYRAKNWTKEGCWYTVLLWDRVKMRGELKCGEFNKYGELK